MPTCVIVGPRASGKTTFIASLIDSSASIHSTQSVDDVYCDGWVLRDIPGFNTELLVDVDLVILLVPCFGGIRCLYDSIRHNYSGNLCIVLSRSDVYSPLKLSVAYLEALSAVNFFDTVSLFLCNCLDKQAVKSIWRLCIN